MAEIYEARHYLIGPDGVPDKNDEEQSANLLGEYTTRAKAEAAVERVAHRTAPAPQREVIKRIAERIGLMESGFVRAVLAGRTEMPPPEELPPI